MYIEKMSWLKYESISETNKRADSFTFSPFSFWQGCLDTIIRWTPILSRRRRANEKLMLNIINQHAEIIVNSLEMYKQKFDEIERHNSCYGNFSEEAGIAERDAREKLITHFKEVKAGLEILGIGGYFYRPLHEKLVVSGYPGHININPSLVFWKELPKFFNKRV